MTIRLAAFDLSGTIVDHGSMGPVLALREAFSAFDIAVTEQELRAPMGRGKLDHVREMLAMPRIASCWREAHGKTPGDDAAHAVHDRFVPIQIETARQRATLIGGFKECRDALAAADVAMAVTTGYPRAVGQAVLDSIRNEFVPVASYCTDDVPRGRPFPDMLQAVMAATSIDDPASVVAVGDTVPDIAAALAAGVRAVGIAASGSEVGLDAAQLDALSATDREARIDRARAVLRDAGAHVVLDHVGELPGALGQLA